MQSDAELIKLSRSGNSQAFAELVKRYELIVKKTTFSMCGRDIGQDIAQEVFIRFFRSMDQFQGEAKLSTYLTRIAINLSLNEIEKGKRKKANEARYLDTGLSFSNITHHEFENRELIEKALSFLDPEFRSVVVLRLIEGYTVEEAAKLLRIPKGTVASRLNRAQQKLREVLKNLNQTE